MDIKDALGFTYDEQFFFQRLSVMTFDEVSCSHWTLPTCTKVISDNLLKMLLTFPSRIVACFPKMEHFFLVTYLSIRIINRCTRWSQYGCRMCIPHSTVHFCPHIVDYFIFFREMSILAVSAISRIVQNDTHLVVFVCVCVCSYKSVFSFGKKQFSHLEKKCAK